MIISIMSTIGALGKRLGIVKKNLQLWLGFTKADVLGKELLIDGDFLLTGTQAENTTGDFWTTQAGWTISGGIASCGSGSAELSQESDWDSVGSLYLIEFYVESYTSGVLLLSNSSMFPFTNLGATSVGKKIKRLVATRGGKVALFSNSWRGSISNLSIKEVAQFIPDKSTNTNNAKLFTGKALSFDGVNDYIELGNPNVNLKSICFWVNLSTTSEQIFNLTSTHNITASSGVITLGGTWSNSNIYVNGLDTTAIGTTPTRVVITTDTNILVNDLEFAKIGSDYGALTLADVQIYDAELSLADALIDYNNPNDLVFNKGGSIALSNLKGYWALSEGSGSIAYDSATPLGSEEVVNGNFATDSNWTKGAGWSIANGTAIQSGGTGQLFQTGALTAAKSYSVTVTIDSIASGTSLKVVLGSGGSELVFSNVGTTTLTGTAALDEKLYLLGSGSGFSATISNISVKEVSAGTITGATYDDKQPTIPQLGMMDWAKSTPDGTNEITLIEAPNDLGKDILGNSLTLRDGGFNLDGSGYGEVSSSSSLNIANYSIDGWIYATNTTSSHQSILTKHTQDNYQLYVRNSQIKLFNSTNGETLLASINLNVWNYFCITESEGVIKFYLNNGSAQSIGTVSQKLATNGKLYIGSHQSADFWKGLIDDVRLYNGILSDKEVLNNYKIGLSKHS